MSGFEIVGVVLGGFPIVIGALKFCAEERGIIKDLFHYEHVLKRIVRSLSREQTSFKNSCKRFMEDIANQCGVGEEEISEMMQDPKDPRWREGDLVQEQIFSQKSVKEYLDTVEDMNEELEKIKEIVTKYGDNGQPQPSDKKAHRRQWKKIILALKKDEITQHLREAERLNNFLARLTQQNQPIVTTRRVSRRSTRHYKRIRSHAIGLYETLHDRFPTSPSCNCILRHDVNMKLEFRSAKTVQKGYLFHAIFISDPSESFPSSWNWKEIEMEPWNLKTIQIDLCQDATSHHSTATTIAASTSSSRDSSRVKFPMESPSPPVSDYEDISNMCATITAPMSSCEWLGSITCKKGRQHRIRAIDHQQRLPNFENIDTVSLAQVIRHKAIRREHRSRLGLKLASSVMQLHTTEWMTDYWSKDDIFFLQSSDLTVDFDNPLIRRSFGTRQIDLRSISEELPKPLLSASIPCLFSLGIVLLELWYRERFEDLKTEKERDLPLEYSDPLTARRLTNEMECSPNYRNSVLRCVSGLDAVYTSLEEDRFRDEVEEKILLPLEEDLKLYCDKSLVEDCI